MRTQSSIGPTSADSKVLNAVTAHRLPGAHIRRGLSVLRSIVFSISTTLLLANVLVAHAQQVTTEAPFSATAQTTAETAQPQAKNGDSGAAGARITPSGESEVRADAAASGDTAEYPDAQPIADIDPADRIHLTTGHGGRQSISGQRATLEGGAEIDGAHIFQ